MYVGELAQDAELADAYAAWVTSAWQSIRRETPPTDVVMTFVEGLMSGRTTPDAVLQVIQGG